MKRKFRITLNGKNGSKIFHYRDYTDYAQGFVEARTEFGDNFSMELWFDSTSAKKEHELGFMKRAISNITKHLHKSQKRKKV